MVVMPALLRLALLFRLCQTSPQTGGEIPLDLVLHDEAGNATTLRAAAAGKPFLLAPLNYRCPHLCARVLDGLRSGLKETIPRAGRQFQVLTIGFDEREDAGVAAARKAACLVRYQRPGAAQGWRFLSGTPDAIARLRVALDLRSPVDPLGNPCGHPGVLIVLAPDGRICRSFFGSDFPPRDLRLAIAEASQGKSGSFIDPLLLFCYQYDPATGRYGIASLRLLRLGGAILVGPALLLALARRRRRSPAAAGPGRAGNRPAITSAAGGGSPVVS